jgi:hypothetical protein
MELVRHPARLANTARRDGAIAALAQKESREPQCELLLSYASWTLQEETRRQRIACKRILESLAERGVAVERKKWHISKIRERPRAEKHLRCQGSRWTVAD